MSSVVKIQERAGEGVSWVAAALADAAEVQKTAIPESLQHVAKEAAVVWSKVLFPTPRLEEWKYTNTESIANGAFSMVGASAAILDQASLEQVVIPGLDAYVVVFVDGVYAPALSTASMPFVGLTVSRLSQGSSSKVGASGIHKLEPFAALATALVRDGVEVVVAKGVTVATPLHIINVTTPRASSCVVAPRISIVANESSHLTVIDSHMAIGGEGYLSLPVLEVYAEANAIVDLYRFQSEATNAYHVSATSVEQAQSSSVNAHFFSFGSALARNSVKVALKGSGCSSLLNGLSVIGGSQHIDNSTEIHHIEPACESREHFKGIYGDTSKGVFSGTITVEQIAQKTNAFQSNQALLLSPTASIETRPQLKILADDVKCTHGATVGQLDADALFYLRSRGIGREDARNFLIHAFASEVLTTIRLQPLRDYVERVLTAKLGQEQE